MRCLSCDCLLFGHEITRKYKSTGEYIDLCDNCFSEISDFLEVIEKEQESDEFYAEKTENEYS